MYDYDDEKDLRPSKSQIKREMVELQKLGEELASLGAERIKKADIPDELREAVLFGLTLKKHEAVRRHFQYIGKILRTMDIEPIRRFLEEVREGHRVVTDEFHQVEQWRNRLVDGDDDLIGELFDRFPDIDGQRFRQLVRNARSQKEKSKPPKAARELFRMLRELYQSSTDESDADS